MENYTYHGKHKGYLYTRRAVHRKRKGHCWEFCNASITRPAKTVLLTCGVITHTAIIKNIGGTFVLLDPTIRNMNNIVLSNNATASIKLLLKHYKKQWQLNRFKKISLSISEVRIHNGMREDDYFSKLTTNGRTWHCT